MDRDVLPPSPARPAPSGTGSSRPLALASLGVFAVASCVYLITMSRSVGFIDRGELAAVATTLGIAHPTGYPTITMLGHLVSRLWPSRPLLALNVLAALLVAAGAGVLVVWLDGVVAGVAARVLHRSARPPRGSTTPRTLDPTSRATIAACAALAIALTPTWWQQANGFEVYPLQALMLPLTLIAYRGWIDATSSARLEGSAEAWRRAAVAERWLGLAVGLSFTNHMTTVLLAPALLVDTVFRLGVSRATVGRVLRVVPWFALGLVPYVYLPWRAATHPRFDWGNVDTLHGFLLHLSGWQYRVWMFSGGATVVTQLKYLLSVMPEQLVVVGLVIAAAGAVRVVRADRRLALMLTLLIVAPLVYAANYEIRDIDAYVLTTYAALAALVAVGLAALADLVTSRGAIAIGAALALVIGVVHARACDESRCTLAEDLTRDQLGQLPEHAVLLSIQWDYTVSPSFYLQEVEGLRRDVTVVEAELMRRSWYLSELERREPELTALAEPAFKEFREALVPFEHGGKYDSARLQATYVGVIDALVESAHAASRPVFVTPEVDARFAPRFHRVPYGLVQWLRPDTAYVPMAVPAYRFRPWRGRMDTYVVTVHRIYAQSLAGRMAYEIDHRHGDLARAFGAYALSFDPHLDPEHPPRLALDGAQIYREAAQFFDGLQRFVDAPTGPLAPGR
jgi:hypothetical protein